VKTLLIEDDVKTARSLKRGLDAEGFETRIALEGEEGFFLLSTESFDLAILDWMLPERDGVEVLRALRHGGNKMPILLLTARDAVEDRVVGLDAGADDYLVKPFAFAELLARLRALRRRAGQDEPGVRKFGDLSLDLSTRRVTRAGKEIALTPREFDLLAFLASHQGSPVTRQMIAQEIWREPRRLTSLDNVIDVHLAHLRRKVDEGFGTKLIHTMRGVGFVLRMEPVQ
jgi:two-component system, OmpR family, copper resistance phosphate regulon response regulator CusR